MGLLNILFGKGSFGRKTVSQETSQRIKSDWQNIQALLSGGAPSQMKQALITADKTLDNALRDVVAGDTMGDRLKNAKDKFDYSLYDKLWKAHKMRNSLVHEAGYDPQHHMIMGAVADLKKGVQKLGVSI